MNVVKPTKNNTWVLYLFGIFILCFYFTCFSLVCGVILAPDEEIVVSLPTETSTVTSTLIPTNTATPIPTATSTSTNTPTLIPTSTSTPTPTFTPIPTFTSSSTHTATAEPTSTKTSTPTPTSTSIPTNTNTPIPATFTPLPLPTFTPVIIPTSTIPPIPISNLQISRLQYDSRDEYTQITNSGSASQDMTGWQIFSIVGTQTYGFPSGYILGIGASVNIHTGPDSFGNPPMDLHWTNSYIWNNKGDKVELKNNTGEIVDSYCYGKGC